MRTGPDHLTAREREVLQLMVRGRTDRQIGAELCITRGTASNYVGEILHKLRAPNRASAIAIALQRHLTELPGSELAES